MGVLICNVIQIRLMMIFFLFFKYENSVNKFNAFRRFGGGPVCNRLYICGACQQKQEALRQRKQYELCRYLALHHEFQVCLQVNCLFLIKYRAVSNLKIAARRIYACYLRPFHAMVRTVASFCTKYVCGTPGSHRQLSNYYQR